MRKPKDNLSDFYCKKCGRFLAGTFESAKAYCPKCKVWSNYGEFKGEIRVVKKRKRKSRKVS